MAFPTVYFMGGEDTDFYTFTGGVDTGVNSRRSSPVTYARCALNCGNNGWWQSHPLFSVTTFWAQGWCIQASVPGGTMTNGAHFFGFGSTQSIYRLGILGAGSSGTFKMVKQNAAGTQTQLGSNFTITNVGSTLLKIVVYVDYQVAGTVTVWQVSPTGERQVFTYSGDVTTDGITSLSTLIIGSPNQTGAFGTFSWSEMIVADSDCRAWNLQTLQPVANGNTHDFDTGAPAASNVNEITLSDATLDGSTTAGQIDQYTIPSIASGSYSIIAVSVGARLMKGSSGPSKMDIGVRSGGGDYWSADQTLTTNWDQYMNVWNTDPATAAVWAALPSNIGLKSVT